MSPLQGLHFLWLTLGMGFAGMGDVVEAHQQSQHEGEPRLIDLDLFRPRVVEAVAASSTYPEVTEFASSLAASRQRAR